MVTDEPEDSNADNGRAAAPNLVVLQCVASVGGTLIGEALGSSLPWKLLAGVLGAATGAFLTAPGTHHRRRIVAVALFLAALQALRRTPDALASRRHSGGRPVWAPASWAAVGLTAAAGFAVGSGITTARGGWPDKDKDQPPAAVLATVPDVAGEPRATALMILEDAGFSPTSTTEPSQSISAGEATRTDPPAGTPVDAGAAVALFVSSGPPPAVEEVVVPDVAGRVEAEALATLEAAGLDATKTTDEPSESIAAGAATRTEPPAGTPVDRGTSLMLFVSSGPEPPNENGGVD